MRARSVALVAVVSATLALTACARMPTASPSGDPGHAQASPSSGAPTLVAGPTRSFTGTPPDDPAALSLARDWITAVTPPPGVRTLDGPPAGAPREPATMPACDWLVQATTWWSTDGANAAAASAWLTQHPVKGLAADATMTGPGESSAVFEHAPQKQDDSIGFDFVPDGDSVTIRVDVIVVPTGAQCASAGGAQSGPANSAGR